MKTCITCIHHQSQRHYLMEDRCTHTEVVKYDPVNGKLRAHPCVLSRGSFGKCGLDGVLYEPKPILEEQTSWYKRLLKKLKPQHLN